MKTKRRTISLLVTAVILAALSLTGCNNADEPKVPAETQPQILTNVFRGADITLPEGYYINQMIDIACADSRMKMVCETSKQTDDGYAAQYCLYEVGLDGSEPKSTELNLDENTTVSWGCFTDSGVIFQSSHLDEKTGEYSYDIVSYSFADGTSTVIGSLSELYPAAVETQFSTLSDIETDSGGNIYLTSGTVCVLDGAGKRICELAPPTAANGNFLPILSNSLQKSPDGRVWLSTSGGLMPIDKDKRTYGEPLALAGDVQTKRFFFGEGYDFYYTTDEGLYGYSDGMETGEQVLDWANSNLVESQLVELRILTPEIILAGDGNGINLLERSADINLNELVTINVAFAEVVPFLEETVQSFNQSSESVRVILKDYTEYNTAENPTGGTTALANDILTGIYQPDIVVAQWKSALTSALLENDSYTDLYQYIDADSEINRDDILGCVTTTFTVDGQLAAICDTLSVQTLLANPESVGGRTSWTLDEMLDFAASLDDEQILMENLTRDNALTKLLGPNGYSAFIDMDNHTCNFSDPTFVKLLSYISTLPVNPREGTPMLKWKTYSSPASVYSDVMFFGTDEVARIGYPTDGTSGSVFNDSFCYIITKQSTNPAAAWEFIRSILLNGEKFGNICSLKPIILSDMQTQVDRHTQIFYPADGGSTTWSGKNPWKMDENGRLDTGGGSQYEGSQGILIDYTMNPVVELVDWLDGVGTPIKAAIPAEVSGIVDEEISAYLSGSRDADKTAEVIQSRVSIWLSEHS